MTQESRSSTRRGSGRAQESHLSLEELEALRLALVGIYERMELRATRGDAKLLEASGKLGRVMRSLEISRARIEAATLGLAAQAAATAGAKTTESAESAHDRDQDDGVREPGGAFIEIPRPAPQLDRQPSKRSGSPAA